jgi:transposase
LDHATVDGQIDRTQCRRDAVGRNGATDTEKNRLKPWQKKQWCLGQVTTDFLWRMAQILDVYAEPYDPEQPVICFDEMPYQRLADVREPLLAAPGKARREDDEYERKGTCNVLLAFKPLTGRRHVTVTETRKNPDFAQAMQESAETPYPNAKELRIVLDNLSMHTPAAFYQTFAPEVARQLTRKIALHYTPKHGSWLNMAECEFSVLSRQYLHQRLPT